MARNTTKNPVSSLFLKFLYVAIFIVIIFLIFYLLYLVYMEIPGNPENLEVIIRNNLRNNSQNESQVSNLQFYPNMKFNHNNISYLIYPDCDESKKARILRAFGLISDQTGIISFVQVNQNPDIEIICSENKDYEPESNKGFFIAGEGGAKEIIKTGYYNIITNGTVFLYKYPFRTSECNLPVVEIHEILHVFGFDHSEDTDSLMNPVISSCRQKLDSSIISELKRLYSGKNLADLEIQDLKVIKTGRYIDYNVTIKNSGVIDAESVNLSILDDGELVESRQIGDLNFGAGITIMVENLKLIHRNPMEIEFIVDRENKIKESNKDNNIVEIKINEA